MWRALHLEVDELPHVFNDDLGLKLAAPDEGWRNRPDMDPERTKYFRASIIARARFIEDLVGDESLKGVDQYVILGAGLDTFVQRRPELAAKFTVFEVDEPNTQIWKTSRLKELAMPIPDGLKFVPVDFDAGEDWWALLKTSGFDTETPAVVTSTGVSMYISKEATTATFRQVAELAPGSTLAMTFLLPIDLVDPEVRIGMEMSQKGASASGTPFISFYEPQEIVDMAREAGFVNAQHISSGSLAQRYFAGRNDGFRPLNSAEELLLATT